MGKEVALTPDKLVDNLKEKIKVEFVNLVPEKEWDKLITETIAEFKSRELEKVLREELVNVIKGILKKHLDEITSTVWDNSQQRHVVNNELRQMILAMAPQLITSMISGQIHFALEQVKFNSNNY